MIKYPLNVTIDTNVFEANKFDFGTDSTMSLLIKNVQNGKIKLVLSNIVINEVEKHICQRVDDVCGKARKLRKTYLDILPGQYLDDIGLGIYVQIPDKESIHKRASDVFAKFLENCMVERLDTSSVNLEEILKDYFAVRLPFENSKEKRKEFPDAFIAEEIRKRFGNDEIVAIVSQDNGFKAACTSSKNHLFFSSLRELFNQLSQNDIEYTTALESIKTNRDAILQAIENNIDDSRVEVHGLSYDRDGIADGYDYDETYLEYCHLSGIKLHTIDDIDEDIIMASIWIQGNIAVNCYYGDYNNSPWDSEIKEYVSVEQKHILEKHDVRFACRIELNKKTNELRVLPFKIVLGGDSRKSRIEIDDEQDAINRELDDADREELGFSPLSKYNDLLQNSLDESSMAQEILEIFNQYNTISSGYDEIASLYDDVCTHIKREMKDDDAKAFIAALSANNCIPIDFSEKSIAELLDEINTWLNEKYDMASERMEQKLPDCFEYGESINISGANNKVYTLSFDELHGTPEAGSEEQIEVSLVSDKQLLAKGYVKLTVGYLDFDEDGGAADGIVDSIDYEVDGIVEALKGLISSWKGELVNEQKLANLIKNCLEQDTGI